MTPSALSRREADVLRALFDTVVAPAGGLPPPSHTDSIAAIGKMLASVPRANRLGLRLVLWLVELGPRAAGFGGRLRQLDRARRAAWLDRLERGRLAQPVEGLLAIVRYAYYGDPAVMASLGYDADAVVARGRVLRTAEGRW
jgi:hypothetical protein